MGLCVTDYYSRSEYFSEHNCIPCLWSNIPLFENGVPATKFTADHLLQIDRVLTGSRKVIGEHRKTNVYRYKDFINK